MLSGRARWHLPGWLPALLLLIVLLAVRAADPALVVESRLRVFDAAQLLSPRPDADEAVVIVAVDDEALTAKGQWPWPRTLVAELVRRIAAGKPSVLGVDILFAEPDRFSPPRLAETVPGLPPEVAAMLVRLPSSDVKLAEAIALVPTVLVADPSTEPMPEPAGSQQVVSPVRQQGADPMPFLSEHVSLIRTMPEIARAEAGEGSSAIEPDLDGILRRIPLIAAAEGRLLPGFAAQIVAVAHRRPSLVVETGERGVEHVLAGNLVAPTDGNGRAIMHFASPELRYISAAAMLDPGFDASGLGGRIVLLGVTGLGTVDQQKTPLGLMEGVQVQAQLVQSILDNALLHRPPLVFWLELALILLAGAIAIGLIRYEQPFLAIAAVLLMIAVLVGGEFALFRFARWQIDGTYAAASALLCFGVMITGHLRAAQAARRQLATQLAEQRERNARLAGELEAARSIQMGLLPRRFPVFTERDDIDLYAFIEPAREVGGDLFVFRLVDDNRLFFLIGDVSGKGIAAALFMAMTSEVVHDAARRHGTALTAVLGEANGKIAAASADMAREGGNMMFVTAFAGILDLGSGELAFASAGHDAPYVVQRGAPPRYLGTEGGPPLGVVEDFTFPVDHDRLDLGQVLLLYTDGVTEATNDAGTLYGKERLAAVLAVSRPADARTIIDAVTSDVRAFAAGSEQADDIALLAVRRAAGTA